MTSLPTIAQTIEERENALVVRYSFLPSPWERLEEIINAGRREMDFPAEDLQEKNLVPGCQTRVWLTATWPEGKCNPLVATDSAVVGGLARLICEVCRGALPSEVAVHELTVIQQLGLDRILSPTRLNGLTNISNRLQVLARLKLMELS